MPIPKSELPVSPLTVRHLSGTYSFQMQGWLRAHDETGQFIFPGPARKEAQLESPVVMAGFQGQPPGKQPDVAKPLPPQVVNTGYYPYGYLGIIKYETDGTVSGHVLLCIGGNTSGDMDPVAGTYRLHGAEGTMTLTDASNSETLNYYIVVPDDAQEIMVMAKDGIPNAPGRFPLAFGIQKKLSDGDQ
jgi:hypothetical protein